MELLTIRETARRGPLNENALRRRVKEHSIPFIKTGNRPYIPYEILLEQLERESRDAVQAQTQAAVQ